MNKYLSVKLKAISFFLTILVVCIHSYNLRIIRNGEVLRINKECNSFFQYFFSQGLATIAVPLFFIISGYLFFQNIENGIISDFINKYKKRIHTLVIPYLLWSIFGVLYALIIQTIISKPFFTKVQIRDYSLFDLLYVIFCDPIPYQFWFIRDLIVLIFISPLIFWAVKYLKYFTVLVLLLTWLFNVNFVIFNSEALFFFTIGSFFSLKKIKHEKFKLENKYLFFIVSWILLVLFETILIYEDSQNNNILTAIHKTGLLFGILSIWVLYDRLFKNREISSFKVYSFFQFSFFLYALHEPVLSFFKVFLFHFLGETAFFSFITYILAPSFTIFLVILIGFLLKKSLPQFYYFITGGR